MFIDVEFPVTGTFACPTKVKVPMLPWIWKLCAISVSLLAIVPTGVIAVCNAPEKVT